MEAKQLELPLEYLDHDGLRDPRDVSVSQMVQEYRETAGQEANHTRSLDLIQEEFTEWVEAQCFKSYEEELKELADLVYVIYGYAEAKCWDLDEAIRRIHENNMGRMMQPDGTIMYRPDGKVVKNPHFPKVDLSDLV